MYGWKTKPQPEGDAANQASTRRTGYSFRRSNRQRIGAGSFGVRPVRALGAAGWATAGRAGFQVGERLAGAAATEVIGAATAGEPEAAASGRSTTAEATAAAAFGCVGGAANADVGGEIETGDLELGVAVVADVHAGAAARALVGCHGCAAPRKPTATNITIAAPTTALAPTSQPLNPGLDDAAMLGG
jgi:hypothetical protein